MRGKGFIIGLVLKRRMPPRRYALRSVSRMKLYLERVHRECLNRIGPDIKENAEYVNIVTGLIVRW
jgi:hypothetical protein